MKDKQFPGETACPKIVETNSRYFPLVNTEAQKSKPKQEEMFMSTATHVNQVEVMYSSKQLAPRTALVSDNKIGNSHGFPYAQTPRPLPTKTLRELLGCIGKNPKLVGELTSKNSRDERIDLLIDHKLIASKDDLPSGKEIKQKTQYSFVTSKRPGEMPGEAKVAWAIIVHGASYEN